MFIRNSRGSAHSALQIKITFWSIIKQNRVTLTTEDTPLASLKPCNSINLNRYDIHILIEVLYLFADQRAAKLQALKVGPN